MTCRHTDGLRWSGNTVPVGILAAVNTTEFEFVADRYKS